MFGEPIGATPTVVDIPTLRDGLAATQPARHARGAGRLGDANHVKALVALNDDAALRGDLSGFDLDAFEEQVALADSTEQARARRYLELLLVRWSDYMLAALGAALVAWFLLHVVTEWGTFASSETGKAFLLPALLTVAALPITYALGVVSAYEQIFWRLGFAHRRRRWTRAKVQIGLACGLRLRRVERFMQFALPSLMSLRNDDDVRVLVARFKAREARCPIEAGVSSHGAQRVGFRFPTGCRADVHPLAVPPEEAQDLGRLVAGAAEPVRHPGVELGRPRRRRGPGRARPGRAASVRTGRRATRGPRACAGSG